MKEAALQKAVDEYMAAFYRDGLVIEEIDVSKDVVVKGDKDGYVMKELTDGATITIRYGKPDEA